MDSIEEYSKCWSGLDKGLLCGSLNANGPHKLIGSVIIRRCGFVRVGVVLLEGVRHCGGRL